MHLWLDDERDPTDPVIQLHFGAQGDEIWVKTAWQAINRLKSGQVTSISFDHDLGPNAGNGSDVARWIEEQAYKKQIPPLDWTVHSQNPVGARYIRTVMKSAERFWR